MVKLISKQIAVSTLEPSIRLDDVLRSYDLEDTQFEIKVLNEDLDLTDATIHCVTKYFSHGKSYAFEKLIKPKSKDVIVFSLPEELKGYGGKIYVGLYAELGDERVDIKDIEVTINNSIIDEDIDFSTVNYFESFERMVEKVDLATEDALDNIKHDKEHVELSRDYAERKMDEDIEEVDTRAKEVLENIDEKDKKVNELADKLNTDIEDFEQIKITAKEVSDNAVREISQTKDTVISEIESVSDSFKAKKTEFDTVVNGIATNFDAKIKDLDTYTEEKKLHIDEKTKSFNTLVDEKTGELTQLNNTFNQELEKSGVTLTTAQDLNQRVIALENKDDKDTVYDDTEIKQRIKALEDKPDTEPYDDSEIREMFNSIGEYVGDVLPTKLSDIDNKQSEHTKAIDKLEQDNLVIEQKISSLEQNSETRYDDTELRNRITELESKEDKDTVYNDSEIRKMLDDVSEYNEVLNKAIHDLKSESTASQNSITELKSTDKFLEDRIGVLESKEDKDTVYDDTSIKQSISNVDTKVDNLSEKVTELEQRPSSEAYDDSELVSRVTALESRTDNDTIYNDAQLKEEISETKSKVDSLSEKVSSLESKPDKDTIYDDRDIKRRISALEQKEDHDTIYDDTEIKQSIANVDNKMSGLSEKVTALEERPIVDTALTERVEALERKEDKDTVYDDTEIKERIGALEEKPDKDTIYDDSNLKAQISELQEKLKALNVRRAPTGYTLDRTTTPWTIWFDNGCGLRIPEYSTTATVYGYGFGASYTDNNITTYPIIHNIIRASNGSLTIEKIKTIKGGADFWSPSIKIINPIRNRDDYDWENARFNPEALSNNSYQYVRQQYFIRTMYELGIWSEADVLYLGATKK